MNHKIDAMHIAAAWQRIESAQSVTLLTHQNPDPDGISACAALSELLLSMHKKVETVYLNNTEFFIARQPANILINQHQQIPDLLIACDTANYERLYYPELFKSIPLINIDHHMSNTIAGTINLVDANVSSACELLVTLLKAWKAPMSKSIAEALLFGMLYDTQVFQTQPTNAQTLRIAADLMESGANLYELKRELLAHKNPKTIALWGRILQKIEFVPEKKTAIACVMQDDLKDFALDGASIVGLNNFLATLADIDVAVLLYEEPNGKTKVSLRSRVTDVNALASHFKGGGHKHAAGILSDLGLSELKAKIKALL